jgi:hypothetical protein
MDRIPARDNHRGGVDTHGEAVDVAYAVHSGYHDAVTGRQNSSRALWRPVPPLPADGRHVDVDVPPHNTVAADHRSCSGLVPEVKNTTSPMVHPKAVRVRPPVP